MQPGNALYKTRDVESKQAVIYVTRSVLFQSEGYWCAVPLKSEWVRLIIAGEY